MTGFILTLGCTVHINFLNANTAAAPTLNINSTGAKPIIPLINWQAGSVISFTYDGISWVQNDIIPSSLVTVSATQPTSALTGDLWFKITT